MPKQAEAVTAKDTSTEPVIGDVQPDTEPIAAEVRSDLAGTTTTPAPAEYQLNAAGTHALLTAPSGQEWACPLAHIEAALRVGFTTPDPTSTDA